MNKIKINWKVMGEQALCAIFFIFILLVMVLACVAFNPPE